MARHPQFATAYHAASQSVRAAGKTSDRLLKWWVFAVMFVACCTLSTAQAGSAVFSTTNIQYLYGTKYADFDPAGGFSKSDEAGIITVEHFNVWKYGDNFFFVDITNPASEGDAFGTTDKGAAGFYGEVSPRLSLSKISGKSLSTGVIQDVLLTSTVEIPQSPVEQTMLYGLAVDLKLPMFQFFQINWYIRNNQATGIDTGQQVTLVWALPFKLGPVPLLFEGFFDVAWGEDPLQDNIITGPRLLVDVGDLIGGGAGNLQAGVEYQIWHNKFGIDGMDEDAPQAMVKWIW